MFEKDYIFLRVSHQISENVQETTKLPTFIKPAKSNYNVGKVSAKNLI
jgi:hypothetical protein